MCNWSTTLHKSANYLRVVQSAQLATPTPSKEQIIVYPAQFGRKFRGMLQYQTYLKWNQLVISTHFCVKAWQRAKGIAQIPHLENSCLIMPLAPPHLRGTIVSWMDRHVIWLRHRQCKSRLSRHTWSEHHAFSISTCCSPCKSGHSWHWKMQQIRPMHLK